MIIEIRGNPRKKRVKVMKKLEIITRPEKLDDLKAILTENGATGIMVTNITGHGNQQGKTYVYRGVKYYETMVAKVKVETVVTDALASLLIEKITEGIRTGNFGDGKIFVYEVYDAIRIRTGERGESAI